VTNIRTRIERLERRRPADRRRAEPLSSWEQATALVSFYRRVALESGADLGGVVGTLSDALLSGDVGAMSAAVDGAAGTMEDLDNE